MIRSRSWLFHAAAQWLARFLASSFVIPVSPIAGSPFDFADGCGQRRDDFEEVADDSVVGHFEDGRVFIFIDGDDALRAFHADQVLYGSADADGEIDLGRDGLSGAAD